MTLSEELTWRGFVNQTTFEELTDLDKKKWTFYHGFDASADSQTIGNLAGMMMDRVFMRHGCTAIILAGGATSLIGDPGGKDIERPLQDEKTIDHNIKMAKEQMARIFRDQKFRLVNNLDWTRNLSVIDFLRDIGKFFGMTSILQRDYIAKRIGKDGTGISFTEISYTLLQGMDFQFLYDKYGCNLQLSGSDQWGNCLSGVDLIRKSRGAEVHALTMPLIIDKATGKKFGKSEAGAVWLDPARTSVYQFYQFWMNVEDEGVEDYLKIYTELQKEQIDNIMREFGSNKSARLAQRTLAYEVTKIVHGEKEAEAVVAASAELFSTKTYDFEALSRELPVYSGQNGASILGLLLESGLVKSMSEGRRFLGQGAIYLNDNKVVEDRPMSKEDALDGQYALLRKGKNQTILVRF